MTQRPIPREISVPKKVALELSDKSEIGGLRYLLYDEARTQKITLIDNRGSPWALWFRALSMITFIMGGGIATGSQAMQWLGFIVMILIVIGFTAHYTSKDKKELTIKEARDYLDALSEQDRLKRS